MSEQPSQCRLCGAKKVLQKSHIIPAFAIRWLKETGGPVRMSKNINVRAQDTSKEYLFCRECETVLNSFEAPFYREIFSKYTKENFNLYKLKYGPYLYKFLSSISFRIVCYLNLKNLNKFNFQYESLLNFERSHRDFLLGRSNNTGIFEQRMFVFGQIVDAHFENIAPNINRYGLRSIDLDIAENSENVTTYGKFGPFVCIGFIKSEYFPWKSARPSTSFGFLNDNYLNIPPVLFDFMNDRAWYINKLNEGLSEKQRELIREQAQRDLSNGKGDEKFRALEADLNLTHRMKARER